MEIKREFEDVETNLLFNLIRMSEILLADIDRRFQLKGGRFQQKRKQNYTRFIEHIRTALHWFDEAIADDYWVGIDGSSYQFDKMRFEANELIQLLLLYIDRVSLNAENVGPIFKYICSLESCHIITREDLEYFRNVRLKAQE